jgi:hypothetical protein
MTTRSIILLVLFVMVMFLWMLALLGAIGASASAWLPFFACLILGVVVYFGGPQKGGVA